MQLGSSGCFLIEFMFLFKFVNLTKGTGCYSFFRRLFKREKGITIYNENCKRTKAFSNPYSKHVHLK